MRNTSLLDVIFHWGKGSRSSTCHKLSGSALGILCSSMSGGVLTLKNKMEFLGFAAVMFGYIISHFKLVSILSKC